MLVDNLGRLTHIFTCSDTIVDYKVSLRLRVKKKERFKFVVYSVCVCIFTQTENDSKSKDMTYGDAEYQVL